MKNQLRRNEEKITIFMYNGTYSNIKYSIVIQYISEIYKFSITFLFDLEFT